MEFPSIVIFNGHPTDAQFAAMDKATYEWEMRAARGECAWVCADCCSLHSKGMPDACDHGHQGCTDILQRAKREALRCKVCDGAGYVYGQLYDPPSECQACIKDGP